MLFYALQTSTLVPVMGPTTIRAVLENKVGPVRQLGAVIHPVAALLAHRAWPRWLPLRALRAVFRRMAAFATNVIDAVDQLGHAMTFDQPATASGSPQEAVRAARMHEVLTPLQDRLEGKGEARAEVARHEVSR